MIHFSHKGKVVLMNLDKINVNEMLSKAETLLKAEQGLSLALRAVMEILIVFVRVLAGRLSKNSSNSSTPPSVDKKRTRGSKKEKSNKKPGGQNGHEGCRLEKANKPDEIKYIQIDKRTLPQGKYRDIGYESRQVIDFNISKIVTEYRAQVLEDKLGNRYVAQFPDDVKTDVQYGYCVKSHAVYLSQFQLLPYSRIQSYFEEKMNISISTGSLFNFNKEAYSLLDKFELLAKSQLLQEKVLHSDETGINVNKKTLWLHSVSSELWSYFYPHGKRGREAMDEMGVLPNFTGTLIHDHWKPYYTYSCKHALCNAHHIRELTYAAEEDNQIWAANLKSLLLEIDDAVNKTTVGALPANVSKEYKKRYCEIIKLGEKECLVLKAKEKPKRGRIKKSKSRNLLERLRDFKDDVLRFMYDRYVPFTNNRGENDLRMTKVQQKISGCFRSIEGAHIFCRVRSYLLTCQKHGVSMTEALELLFQGKVPKFLEVLFAQKIAE
jgi:transposase